MKEGEEEGKGEEGEKIEDCTVNMSETDVLALPIHDVIKLLVNCKSFRVNSKLDSPFFGEINVSIFEFLTEFNISIYPRFINFLKLCSHVVSRTLSWSYTSHNNLEPERDVTLFTGVARTSGEEQHIYRYA